MPKTKTVITCLLLAFATPITLFLAVNWYLAAYPLPQYGSWTGIPPLEAKLRKYEEFAKQGKVDAVILSSSIGDHGVSADVLSQEMTAKLGRNYRAFNFSTGGAEIRTYYSLYLLLRTVAKPAHLYIFHPAENALADKDVENGPDATMSKAPVGESLKDPTRLAMSKFLWALPVINQSSAIRDLLLHGEYKNRKAGHFDTFAINDHGDTLSYNRIATLDTARGAKQAREQYVQNLITTWQQKDSQNDKLHVLISDTDLVAAKKLKELADSDSCQITLVAHDQSAAAQSTEQKYRDANKTYNTEVAKVLGINSLYFLDQFFSHDYEIEDQVHLNIHGARRYAKLFAAMLNNQKYSETETYSYSDQVIDPAKDSTMSTWAAIVLRSKGTDGKTIEASFVQSWQTPVIAVGAAVWLALRLPDKSDVIVEGKVTSPGVIRATFDTLPNENISFILRALEQGDDEKKEVINVPLASYQWLKE